MKRSTGLGPIGRAFISLKKNVKKYLLLLSLIFILGTLVSGAYSASQAIQRTESSLRRSLPPFATIDFDWQSYMESAEENEMEFVYLDQIRYLGSLDYVSDFDYSSVRLGISFPPGVRGLSSSFNSSWPIETTEIFVNRSEFSYLSMGIIQLTEGRTFDSSEMEVRDGAFPILVSSLFAELNELAVGEILTLLQPISQIELEETTVDGEVRMMIHSTLLSYRPDEFRVVGLFEVEGLSQGSSDTQNLSARDSLNASFFLPSWVENQTALLNELYLQELLGDDWIDEGFDSEAERWSNVTFRLRDSNDLEAFQNRGDEMLPSFWRISYLSDTYAYIASSMENLQWLSTLVSGIAQGAFLVIVPLLLLLVLKDRHHEFGIYLALGEKKERIGLQILLEVMVVGSLGLGLSLPMGNFLARNVSGQLLEQHLLQEQDRLSQNNEASLVQFDPLFWFAPEPMTSEEMLAHYEVSFSGEIVALFLGTTGLLLGIGTLIPLTFALNTNPKKILM